MSFLKKLFGKTDSKPAKATEKEPDNTKLLFLLDTYAQHPSQENYKAVIDEVAEGACFLLLPSVNDRENSAGWNTLDTGATLKLTSVYNLDGLTVLGAFTDEAALLNWAKQQTQYTAMKTQDLIDFCQQNKIDRIVINSDQKNMFVLERNRQNITTRTIQEETKVLVGTPTNPLRKTVIDKLVENFRKVDTIDEAYQYAQSMNGETSIVLGIKMSVVSDNSREALHYALNNALADEKFEMPLDIMILETADWLETVRGIENSLFYKR